MPDLGQRYWAFLSYCHEDLGWARRLHRELEAYAVPRPIVGTPTPAGPAPRHFRPIFRDRDELGAAARLGDQLSAALGEAAWLIVVCSPAAARSKWVAEEVRQFKALRGEDRVLAVIVAGEPFASDAQGLADQECFPEPLRYRVAADGQVTGERVEPAAADLRTGKDGRRGALLKLLAGMLGTDLDRLVQRDARRRHQQLLALTAGSLAVSAVLGALAVTAFVERNEAVDQRGKAEDLIEFMVKDLSERLEPYGRLDALDAIGGKALAYYAGQRSHGLDAESLGRRARVLHLLGNIRTQRGDLPGALALFRQANESTAELLSRHPRDPNRILDHAQSAYWVGLVAFKRGQDDIAGRQFLTYQQLAEELVAIDPRNEDWRAELDEADQALGAVMIRDGRPDAAAADFSRALAISKTLVATAPGRRDRQSDEAESLEWLADAEVLRGRADAAIADRKAAGAIYGELIARAPDDNAAIVALASNQGAIARILVTRGAITEAIADLETAATAMRRLIAAAPGNADYKANAAKIFLSLGQALLQAGRLEEAQETARMTLEMCQLEARRNQDTAWSGPRLGGARVLSLKVAAARARSLAEQAIALQPVAVEARRLAGLGRSHPRNMALALVASEADLLAGDRESLEDHSDNARAQWTAAVQTLENAGVDNLPSTDRGRAILRQLEFRLRSGQASAEPILTRPAATASKRPKGGGLIVYEW